MNIYYKNMGAAKMVTGSSHYLEIKDLDGEKDLKIVVDMGQVQDGSMSFSKLYQLNSRKFPIEWETVDYLLITHAHLDHIGLMGRLDALGFKGEILATQLTSELCELNLIDGVKLHTSSIEKENKKRIKSKRHKDLYIPLYTQHSVENVIDKIKGYSYNQVIQLNKKVSLEFLPAGHIGGSSMLSIIINDLDSQKRILFTGDTSCDREIPFTTPVNIENMTYDYIITENTYGDRLIPKTNIVGELKRHIEETCIKDNSKILIPAFSIGRCTNILYYLKELYKYNPQYNDIKIYLISPLALKAHRLLGKYNSFDFYEDKWQNYKDLWNWEQVTYVDNFDKLREIILRKEKQIFCGSSGMLEGGFAQFVAMNFLPKENYKILFCGYQGIGSLGGNLLSKQQKTITISDKDDKKIKVSIKSKIDLIDGMSSHADYKSLIKMFKTTKWTKIKRFIIVHGNEDTCEFFAKQLKNNFNAEVNVPNYGETIKLY